MKETEYDVRLKAICDDLYEKAFKDGLCNGLAAAERIAIWWRENHKLVHPHPLDTLNEWTDAELAKMKARLTCK